MIAYLIPEFPGQTHIFFWREMHSLKCLGVEVALVSTRRPAKNIVSHVWAREAMLRTHYLFPLTVPMLLGGVLEMLRAGPLAWVKCVRATIKASAPLRYKLKMLFFLFAGAELALLARRNSWDHLHVHSCANAATVAMFAHLLSGLPYSLTLHSALPTFGPAQNVKWHYAVFGTAVTHQLRRALLQEVGVPAEKLEVAAMGVDLQVFRRKRTYSPPRLGEVIRVVTCGRLHRGKGHQDIINAVAILRDAGICVELTILGEGPYRAALEQLIEQKRIGAHVRMLGAVAEHVVREELEKAHVFALGSHEEAIGVATMEAMAMALPVVVTDVGGVRELVREGVDGLFARPSDPSALAECIRQLCTHPGRSVELGTSGAARIRKSFSSDVSAQVIAQRIAQTKLAW
jgi:glycosyltransferase involved in cell wall biosynthesis